MAAFRQKHLPYLWIDWANKLKQMKKNIESYSYCSAPTFRIFVRISPKVSEFLTRLKHFPKNPVLCILDVDGIIWKDEQLVIQIWTISDLIYSIYLALIQQLQEVMSINREVMQWI